MNVEKIEILKPNVRVVELTLIGDSPLISHAWSDKARKMMADKQQKKAKRAKAKRDPKAEYEASLYKHPAGGYAMPAMSFKQAAVNACRLVDGIPMTRAKMLFHVVGDWVAIDGKPQMREDMVRLETGVADIRYRGEFTAWRCVIQVRYHADSMSADQLVNLFDAAGFGSGIGDWRPQKGGSFGMFHVATADELGQQILEAAE